MNNPVAKPGGRGGHFAKQVRSWGLDKNELPVRLKGLGVDLNRRTKGCSET